MRTMRVSEPRRHRIPSTTSNCARLDIRAIIDSIDPEPIIKAHWAGGGDQLSAEDGMRR